MALTLRQLITRFTPESIHGLHDLDETVAEVVRFDELIVKGSEVHHTLVTCSAKQIETLLETPESEQCDLLRRCILASSEHSPELEHAVAEAGFAAMLGAKVPPADLFSSLETVLTNYLAADDRMLTTAARVLTKVASVGGVEGVLNQLSSLIDGWAVLLDAHGQVLTSVAAGRLHIDDAISVVLNRPVKVRYPGLQVHVIESGGRTSARLVIAARGSSSYRARSIAALAANIIALMLRTTDPSETERLGRKAIVDTLVRGGDDASALLSDWTITDSHLAAFVFSSKTKYTDVENMVARWLTQSGFPHLFYGTGSEVFGFATKAVLSSLEEKTREFRAYRDERLHLGIGSLLPRTELEASLQQARQALSATSVEGQHVLHFRELSSMRHALMHFTASQQAMLTSVLDPVLHAGPQAETLLETLTVFVQHHGSWSDASRQLGVHRQTLAKRIDLVEQLLGLSLQSADDRATIWLALRSLQQTR